MPKLNKTTAKKVDESSGSFDLVPDGARHLRLRNVDGSGQGPAGPYWTWEFESVEDDEFKNRRFWVNTSLSDAAAFKLKETFNAFGVGTDTDTEELLGQIVKGVIGTRTIQQGDRKGEQANEISKLMPPDEDFEAPEGESSGQPAPDDIFT